jgi:uncharacterized membrane protein
MKICPKCGEKLEDAVNFCTCCGAALNNVHPAADEQADLHNAAAWSAASADDNTANQKTAAEEGGAAFDRKTDADAAANAGSRPYPQDLQPFPNGNGSYSMPYGSGQLYYNPYDHTADFKPNDISDNKAMAMILYLTGGIGLLMGLLYRRSPYVTFHLRQILKLYVLELLTGICAGIIGVIISLFSIGTLIENLSYGMSGFASFLMGSAVFTVPLFISGIVGFIIMIVKIICFFHVCSGKAIEAPVVRAIRFMR